MKENAIYVSIGPPGCYNWSHADSIGCDREETASFCLQSRPSQISRSSSLKSTPLLSWPGAVWSSYKIDARFLAMLPRKARALCGMEDAGFEILWLGGKAQEEKAIQESNG